MLYLVAYDITEDARRQRVSDLLLGYGDRVQRSVFVADLSAKEVQEILSRARKLVGDDDSLLAVPICNSCAAAIRRLGQTLEFGPQERVIV